jgi:hypothetical protein
MLQLTDQDKLQIKIWVAALRSGEYKQTHEVLQDAGGYCCLGVACKVLIPDDQQKRYGDGLLVGKMPHHQEHAPKWLRQINDDFSKTTGVWLVRLNDKFGKTFEEIADVIERVYLK